MQRGPNGFLKRVAIKQLLPALLEEAGVVEMFLDEARIAASLSHPNVCQVFDLAFEHGRHYIAMEYLAGQSLARVWRRGLSPELGAVRRRARCRGPRARARAVGSLGAAPADRAPRRIARERGRDVRRAGEGRRLRLARAANKVRKAKSGVLRGKAAYLSPEQIEGGALDARTDIFALGVMLYEALQGERLYENDSDFDVMQRTLVGAAPKLSRPKLRGDLGDAGRRGAAARAAGAVAERRARSPEEIDQRLRRVEPAPGAAALARCMPSCFPKSSGTTSRCSRP